MLTTAFSVLAALALLVPGFIIVELSLARSARWSRGDLGLALRAIAYALAVHLVFGLWTADLAEKLTKPQELADHLGAVTLYAGVVLLATPIMVGVALNALLGRAELGDGPPGLAWAALGAGEARDAFDYAFQHRRQDGAWVIVEMAGHTAAEPRLVGGIYGRGSAIGQTPSPHDVYLQALCTVVEDQNGVRSLDKKLDPERGVYLSASEIARIDVLSESAGDAAGSGATMDS